MISFEEMVDGWETIQPDSCHVYFQPPSQHRVLVCRMNHFFEVLEENVNKLLPSEHLSFYVCSFSEEPDLLSQWRGYCKNGTGCSLGFALNRLQEIAKRARFVIKPCIYSERAGRRNQSIAAKVL